MKLSSRPYLSVQASRLTQLRKVESTVLLTASHAASSKFADLAISPQFEAVFFFGSQWIQFRIRGKAFGVSPKLQGGEAETEGRRAAEAQLEVETATNGESGMQNWNWEEEIRRAWDRVGEKIKAKYGPVVSSLRRVTAR